MKRSLFLLSCIASGIFSTAAAADPGGVIFIGDSITQGGSFLAGKVASYRYSLFKNFVDNGIRYNPMGTTQGAAMGTDVSSQTPDYMGVQFSNVSESAASGRSYQYAGHEANAMYRQDPGTVMPEKNRGPLSVKLGLENPFTQSSEQFYDGTSLVTYTGDTYQSLYGDVKASTACIMIGINDLYDMSQKGYAQTHEQIVENIQRIVTTLQEYNPDMNVVVMGCLPVGSNNGALGAGVNNVSNYNNLLQQAVSGWSTATSSVQYADVSQGFYASNGAMIDTIRGAHPNAQGELIVAGNIARVLGVGQRTMGLERRSGANLTFHADLSTTSPVVKNASGAVLGTFTHASSGADNLWSSNGSTLSFSSPQNTSDWLRLALPANTAGEARTITLSIQLSMVHDEVTPGSNFLTVFLGDGLYGAGLLAIGEDGIYWGNGSSGTLLYGAAYDDANSHFMTQGIHDLRIVISGATEDGSKGLFQIWLDGQLIGENRTPTLGNYYQNDILLAKRTSSESTHANIYGVSLEMGTAFAPIPEPASASLGIVGMAFLIWKRRRAVCH
ncbi:SGNH/GDSL hydrolase family protein [Akkermansia muciniphila]|uniref:SGNH/GDSL hydrolase family protein n=1 Tax=Akkermansia muciniphila TaxID=239935 RepID=UPI0027D25711|nr:GDSL-type esterase/lipase family protein [Akkermansia muciniphila]WMB14673.1 GDSL-type esterase/lipase family protein [Akkermansia muciniphila]WMB19112.1 GDSL-type esterase/lipase family protein [Akkermansia muciniphila]